MAADDGHSSTSDDRDLDWPVFCWSWLRKNQNEKIKIKNIIKLSMHCVASCCAASRTL